MGSFNKSTCSDKPTLDNWNGKSGSTDLKTSLQSYLHTLRSNLNTLNTAGLVIQISGTRTYHICSKHRGFCLAMVGCGQGFKFTIDTYD